MFFHNIFVKWRKQFQRVRRSSLRCNLTSLMSFSSLISLILKEILLRFLFLRLLIAFRSFFRKKLEINVVNVSSVKKMSLIFENSVAWSIARLKLIDDTEAVIVRLIVAIEKEFWPFIVSKFNVKDEDKSENVAWMMIVNWEKLAENCDAEAFLFLLSRIITIAITWWTIQRCLNDDESTFLDEDEWSWNLKCKKQSDEICKSSCDLASLWSQIHFMKSALALSQSLQIRTMHQSRLHHSNRMSEWIVRTASS